MLLKYHFNYYKDFPRDYLSIELFRKPAHIFEAIHLIYLLIMYSLNYIYARCSVKIFWCQDRFPHALILLWIIDNAQSEHETWSKFKNVKHTTHVPSWSKILCFFAVLTDIRW